MRSVTATLEYPSAEVRPHLAATKTKRNSALDFARGVLVLQMALHHSVDYFAFGSGLAALKYLRFTANAFLLINGFLIASIYYRKRERGEPGIPKRLGTRAFKLLCIFTALNVVGRMAMGLPTWSLATLYDVYVIGNGRAASFEVLVAHAYVLFLGIFIVAARSRIPHIALLIFAFLFLVMASLRQSGLEAGNLTMVTMGLLGMCLGELSVEKLDATFKRFWIYALYGLYLMFITFWNQGWFSEHIGAVLSLGMLYAAGLFIRPDNAIRQVVVRLGNYSLFGYIFHIILLRILSVVLPHAWDSTTRFSLAFVLAISSMIVSVEILNVLRDKIRSVDRVYRFVLG